jgi:hypothetical protein
VDRAAVWAALRAEIATLQPAARDLLEAAVDLGRVDVDVTPAGPDAVTVVVTLDDDEVFAGQLPADGGRSS